LAEQQEANVKGSGSRTFDTEIEMPSREETPEQQLTKADEEKTERKEEVRETWPC
jgi:hypothetical protein